MIAREQAMVPYQPAPRSEKTYGDFFRGVGRGFGIIGKSVCALARHTGRLFRRATGTADSDVRAHLAELPFFGLTQLLPADPADKLSQPLDFTGGVECRPVVMIHGLGGSSGNWGLIRNLLKLRGRRNIFRFDYRGHSSMRSAVPEFEEYLRAVIAQLPEGESIDLLCHSMGGLIARATLRNADIRERIHHVVTIGTPHRGSHLARLGGFKWSQEIRPDSSFMTMLNATDYREIERSELRITAFWTERDVLVIPSHSATLEGAENIPMHDATHVSWLVRPRQAYRLLEALDAPAA